jgi:hypothetical protein
VGIFTKRAATIEKVHYPDSGRRPFRKPPHLGLTMNVTDFFHRSPAATPQAAASHLAAQLRSAFDRTNPYRGEHHVVTHRAGDARTRVLRRTAGQQPVLIRT